MEVPNSINTKQKLTKRDSKIGDNSAGHSGAQLVEEEACVRLEKTETTRIRDRGSHGSVKGTRLRLTRLGEGDATQTNTAWTRSSQKEDRLGLRP